MNPQSRWPNSETPPGPKPASQAASAASLNSGDGSRDRWQTVDFPGTVNVNSIPGVTPLAPSQAKPMDAFNPIDAPFAPDAAPNARGDSTALDREAELLSLVRDLNECNDVLLAKVAQLEEDLDRSQTALQAEIDRTHAPAAPSAAAEARPISDRHLAQLVTELELANQSLKQHQVLNATLQTELTAQRDRATQLEQDYAHLQQQHTDQSQQLAQAEASARDLRARLQRQQRYTLQFKAALEKCLSVSAGTQTASASFVSDAVSRSVLGTEAAAPTVSMPKVPTIQPWTSEGDYAQLDPQLESLIRRTKSGAAAPAADPEAEDRLWYDLARVIDAPSDDIPPLDDEAENSVSATDPLDVTADIWQRSPAPVVPSTPASTPLESATIAIAEPAPVVHPLRPQKRITSLAAIDLPTFPKLPAPSQPTPPAS